MQGNPDAFNRTSMESKPLFPTISVFANNTFNRTSMESKLSNLNCLRF